MPGQHGHRGFLIDFRKEIIFGILILLCVLSLMAAGDYYSTTREQNRFMKAAEMAAVAGNKTIGTPEKRIAAANSSFSSFLKKSPPSWSTRNVVITPYDIVENGKNSAMKVDLTYEKKRLYRFYYFKEWTLFTITADSRGQRLTRITQQ